MPQSDLTSFIPLSLLFIFTFLIPIIVESSFTDIDESDIIYDLSTSNLRKTGMISIKN